MRNIETAVYSARLANNGTLEINPFDEERIRKKYMKVIAELDSTKTKNLLLKLEESPFKFASDAEIQTYFHRFKIPVKSKRDLDLLYITLSDELQKKERNEKISNIVAGASFLLTSALTAGIGYVLHRYFKSIDAPKILDYCVSIDLIGATILSAKYGVQSLLKNHKKKNHK